MLLHGQTTPETYGKLLSWDEHELAFEWMMSGLQFHPGMGLLVLQIQQGVLEFLVLCCRKILQDLSFDSLADSSIPVQPEPATLLPNETAYTSLAALAADAPYRVPAHLDFRHIRSLAAARASAANDHIYALREDPGYFSSVIGDYSEHRQETLLDTNRRRHDVLKEYLFWDRVVGNAIGDAYTAHFIFDTIHKKVVELENLEQRYSESISPQRRLPKQYQQALLNFNHFLDETPKGLIYCLKVGVPPSPPLRSLFVREPQEPNTTKIVVRSRQIASRKDELLRLFQILWDDQQLFLYALPNLMDELERLVESDRQQKQRLSGWVKSIVSDLALLAQMKNQLNLYQPWASTFENDAVEHGEAIKADYTKSMSPVTEYVKASRSLPSVGRLVTPLRDKFNYPIDKPRTRQSSDTMRAAEKNLDLFWKVIDQHFNANCRSDVVEPVNSEKPTKEEAEEDLSDHFSRLSSGQGQSSFETPLPKNKVKTHGPVQKGGSHGAEPPEHVPRTLIPDQQQQVVVGRRAFKVFSTLFHVPNLTDTPGDVAWPDFLHAMASTGFQVVKLYGSVWQFTPTKLDVENSIHFHEPHPIGKTPFRMARRHGRRLHRTYGWTANTFSLA
ncbi:hypothetical protein EPUS_00930 [Endocarpon pusillum Z07020]|uniref:Uncharacterized protein n=1 Tax=Endocarpon pusillum (strain Z07020 / HMAS-L-300199) TaxID=1263415 RepID=U1G8C4_ENDPU|nr:uncharacterized protein EPUS_00930 [Endocarpon pusillum Z07020]ERF73677.1 hypothetical protein EPUS_00930 [Endocarpon pusillum Z07020]